MGKKPSERQKGNAKVTTFYAKGTKEWKKSSMQGRPHVSAEPGRSFIRRKPAGKNI